MDTFLTEDNCKTIINNYLNSADFKIENFDVKVFSTVSGMMAEYYLLTIKFNFNGEIYIKNFFCKKLVMFHKIQEIMGKAQGAFEKEDFIYNFLIKECRNSTQFEINYAPQCYLAIKDKAFVLENLLELGYSIEKGRHDLNHCKIALKAIADFHATSVIYEEFQSILTGEKFSLFDNYKDIFNDSLFRNEDNYLGRKWYKNCMNTLVKLVDLCDLPNVESKQVKEKLKYYTDNIYDTFKPSKHYVNVVCHGDLSDSNILFKTNEIGEVIDCKLIDFQALRYLPPAHDVLTYIFLTTESKFRKKYLNELLEYYHKIFHLELEKYSINKEKHIVLERFHESCEYMLPQIIIITACYATMIPLYLYYPHYKNDQKLYEKFVYQDRSPECIDGFKRGGLFKDIIIDMFLELSAL